MKTPRPIPEESATSSLAGHRFPGGSYQVEHWETFLPLNEVFCYRISGGRAVEETELDEVREIFEFNV